MRLDGRSAGGMRPITFERGFTKYAPGSVLACFGDTKVLCTATIADRVPPFLRDTGQGWVTAEYAMLPGATHTRSSRDAAQKGRAKEISRLIGRSLRAVTDLKGLGECQITLDCDVLQADGGTRTAAISGAFVALYDALLQSVASGCIAQVPIARFCGAVSVGLVDGEALLDLCYEEDFRADVDMNVVMNAAGELVEIQGCAEGEAFSRAQMNAMLDLAEKGVQEIIQAQKEALGVA